MRSKEDQISFIDKYKHTMEPMEYESNLKLINDPDWIHPTYPEGFEDLNFKEAVAGSLKYPNIHRYFYWEDYLWKLKERGIPDNEEWNIFIFRINRMIMEYKRGYSGWNTKYLTKQFEKEIRIEDEKADYKSISHQLNNNLYRPLSLRTNQETYDAVKLRASRMGISVSEAVRYALTKWGKEE